MASSAPRLPWPLVREVRALSGRDLSVAEVWRAACAFADRQALGRPSYEHVRRLVNRERAYREMPTAVEPLIDGWLRARSPENAVDAAFRLGRERAVVRARIEAERTWRPDGRR